MYVIIVGCGKLGHSLTTSLLAMGHEILAIEKDSNLCQRITQDLGSVTLNGDGSQPNVLARAGVKRADVIIAVTDQDQDNLAACQVAKILFGIKRTIALVNHDGNDPIFKLGGVDATINSTRIIASTIEERIPEHPMIHRSGLRNPDTEMVSISIPPDAAAVNRPLGVIELPPNSFICLIVKIEGPRLPSDTLELEAEDEVLAVTIPEEEQLLYQVLTEVE